MQWNIKDVSTTYQLSLLPPMRCLKRFLYHLSQVYSNDLTATSATVMSCAVVKGGDDGRWVDPVVEYVLQFSGVYTIAAAVIQCHDWQNKAKVRSLLRSVANAVDERVSDGVDSGAEEAKKQ